jgi:opacity protein-like surface antigen
MKNKFMIIIVTAALVFSAALVPASATVMLGVKTWYAVWDSAFAKSFGIYLHEYFEDNGFPNSLTVDPGTGYLAGPLVGYQTDDGKWSFSLAYMALSSFDQKSSMDAGGVPVDIRSDMERKDLDISVGYTAMENVKVFAGYKRMDTKFETEVEIGGSVVDFGWYKAVFDMIGLGIGTVYPLSDKLLLSGQAGLMYVKAKLSNEFDEDFSVDDSWGYNVEGGVNYLLSESILLQAGLRYQAFLINVKNNTADFEDEQPDRFVGVTVAAIFMFE